MKITRIDIITTRSKTRLMWVQIHTDSGLIGLGETYDKVAAAKASIIEVFARQLIGKDPLRIEYLWRNMHDFVNMHGYAGGEFRALSAIDMALWDLLGKATGLPVYALLGGRVRETIPVYNTCVNWSNLYNSWKADFNDTIKEAEKLIELGYRGMKIDPFLRYAGKSFGQNLCKNDLKVGTDHIRAIRNACGDKIEIMLDLHAAWNLPAAKSIIKAVEPLDITFVEEPVLPNERESMKELRTFTDIPILESERYFTRWQVKDLLVERCTDILMFDLAWTGGISEGKKIATMAECFGIPISPHNCGGPVTAAASAHICMNVPNVYIMEAVEEYSSYFNDYTTHNITCKQGLVSLDDKPGLGPELSQSFLTSGDAEIITIDEKTIQIMNDGVLWPILNR
jgi:L-alanine-DL-glutamate epimerase-like enolase superfamily enzyme